jgi:hypothetical protein
MKRLMLGRSAEKQKKTRRQACRQQEGKRRKKVRSLQG